MGQRILVGKLSDQGVSLKKVISQKEDYYESVWYDVSLTGWIPKESTVGDAATVWQALCAEDNCTACHGEDANTPADTTYPRLAGQSADYIFKQLQDFRSGTRSNDQDEVMRANVADLSEDDARAVAYWLSAQHAP